MCTGAGGGEVDKEGGGGGHDTIIMLPVSILFHSQSVVQVFSSATVIQHIHTYNSTHTGRHALYVYACAHTTATLYEYIKKGAISGLYSGQSRYNGIS